MECVNVQMDVMTEARDLIPRCRPCPATPRDLARLSLPTSRAYRDEVRQRATNVAACDNGKIGLLYWSTQREPEFHAYLEERCGAVLVGALPQTYVRPVYDDPLRALSAPHIFLFDMTSASWMVNEAQQYGVHAVVGVEDPSPHPWRFRQACESAGALPGGST
jgi:hypothetical protein